MIGVFDLIVISHIKNSLHICREFFIADVPALPTGREREKWKKRSRSDNDRHM